MQTDAGGLRRTALSDLHRRLGARMTAFAGYEMPLHYPDGALSEHRHTRLHAGLFDIGHMGQIVLRPKDGDVGAAASALERLSPLDAVGLAVHRQRYALLLSESGGILDDLMVARFEDMLSLIVNAARKEEDLAHLTASLGDGVEAKLHADRALLALQGPGAEAALTRFAPPAASMVFMDALRLSLTGTDALRGTEAIVTRSGYTGEDGFEISVPADRAVALAEALLADETVRPAGLAARDSLRLEAGLCLHGADIDAEVTIVAADLGWAAAKARRVGGAREGGFPGAAAFFAELENGAPRRRVGLAPHGRAPLRAGAALFARAEDAPTEKAPTEKAPTEKDRPVGRITSGGFSPILERPIAMATVDAAFARPGATLYGEWRGKRIPAEIVELPFIPHRYRRLRSEPK